MTLGHRIRVARKLSGWTQMDLAREVCRWSRRDTLPAPDQISRWETGRRYPHRTSLFALAKPLGVQVSWLERSKPWPEGLIGPIYPTDIIQSVDGHEVYGGGFEIEIHWIPSDWNDLLTFSDVDSYKAALRLLFDRFREAP